MVVRRGQPFQMTLTFDESYNQNQHELQLILETGIKPLVSKGTRVELFLSKPDQQGQWGATLKEQKDTTLNLEITSPPSCIIGQWRIKIRTLRKATMQPAKKVYSHPKPLYVLFNPWCKDDQVYLHDDGLLKEYVLNDTGNIFVGNYKYNSAKPWAFGQFDDPVLDCVLSLLNRVDYRLREEFPAASRSDPVLIVRRLTDLVNHADDNGILIGNWSGDYEGGTKPTFWTGSLEILEKYYETKSPVKFGQCWVFSGVLTTCCRALGIPARSVTNFASAHDTDVSLSIDYHFDEEGQPLEHMDSDSIWNFHVWNDVWMARPDLTNKDYGGWQACDATPQETSNGLYCCGPCPLWAIKNGDVTVPYDGRFIFAEVNADIVSWQREYGYFNKKLRVDRTGVGKCISTNRPQCRVDTSSWGGSKEVITNQYKHTEGWETERAAVMMANMSGTRANMYNQPDEESKDVTVKVVDKEQANYGDNIIVEVELENKSKEDRTVSGTWMLRSFYSTGVSAHQIHKQRLNVKLSPEQKVTEKMEISFRNYNPKTIEGCFFKTNIVCKVMETNQTALGEDDFRLIKPDLALKVSEEVKVGSTFKVLVSFTNPLPMRLTSCSLEVEGPGLQRPRRITQDSVGPKDTFTTEVEMTAMKPGTRTIIASFDSKELVAIDGSCEIEVKGI
ncbi:hemocyte protein-glutamine gamma-glutamyltransferase-like [Argopecten irradians]|uniref:hemocyte protein-glutamine gamma-glutamyltransferase-like n=1 Tax=Argopecten irradians TaxID=31199 RepID=UPI0037157957